MLTFDHLVVFPARSYDPGLNQTIHVSPKKIMSNFHDVLAICFVKHMHMAGLANDL